MRTRVLTLLAACLLAACSDSIPGAGTMVATVVSPNGNDGAAIVTITGPGIESVGGATGKVFGNVQGETATVVVIAEPAGQLSFTIQVADTTADFTGQVVEVANEVDAMRNSVVGYEVEIRR